MILDIPPFVHYLYYGLGILGILLIGGLLGYFFGWAESAERSERKLELSRISQRGNLKGTISEQLAPYLPGFPADLSASEAKFLGKPVDFIVFKGMDENNISEVVFVEVKSGRGHYNHNEMSLKDAIDQKRVRYIPYQVPNLSRE